MIMQHRPNDDPAGNRPQWHSRRRTALAGVCLCLAIASDLAGAAEFLVCTQGNSSESLDRVKDLGHQETTAPIIFADGILAMSNATLEQFCVIWFSPGMDTSDDVAHIRNSIAPAGDGNLEQFVASGGVIVMNVTGSGIGLPEDVVPGGAGWEESSGTHNEEFFPDPSHRYLTGAFPAGVPLDVVADPDTDFSSWNDTDRGVIENIPSGATVILENADGPSMVEYQYGSGWVIITTLRFGAASGGAVGAPLNNLINYAAYLSAKDATPVIACPADTSVSDCQSDSSPSETGRPTVTVLSSPPAAPGCFMIQSSDSAGPGCGITRTWTAVGPDPLSETSCDQFIAGVDETPPDLVVPPDVVVTDSDCSGDEAVALPAATATDACDADVGIVDDAPALFPAGQTTPVTFTATDDCGNESQAVVNVTVNVGGGAISISCPSDQMLECPAPDISPGVTGTATATGCGTVTIDSSDEGVLGCGPTRIVTRTWMAEDAAGNTAECDQLISVVDTTGPVLSVPADAVVGCEEDASPSNTGMAMATDDCDGAPGVTFSDAVAAGSCPQESVITRTWTATDACGNETNGDQIITVVDETAPALTVPADTMIDCADETGPSNTGAASATDDCDPAPAVSFSDSSAPGACPEVSVITRTWTATDACGNSVDGDQTIGLEDTTAPVLTVDTTPITATDVDCSGDEAVTLPAATATDDCDGSPVVSDNAPATFPAGETTAVTFTASDACGNTSAGQDVDVTVKSGATIKVFVHQLTFGWGAQPGVVTEPLVGAEVFAFDRSGGEFCSHHQSWWVGWHWWRHVVHDCDESAAVNSAITDANGIAEIDVPPGDYIVITFFDFDNDGTNDHYLGRRAPGVECGEVLKRRLRLLVTPRGKRIAAKIRRYTGSELIVVEPDLMVWDEEVQEYPYGFESEGDWGVEASIEVPEGFVSDEEQLSDEVVDTTKGLQFTVTEVGSDLVPTKTTFKIRHNGRVIEVPSDVGIMLTPDYALSRGFNVNALRANNLIVEPSALGMYLRGEREGAIAPTGAVGPVIDK